MYSILSLSTCLSVSLSLSLSLSLRSTTDLEYSSFLIQESIRQSQKKKGKDNEEEGEEEELQSPGKQEYRQTLLNALSRNRSQPRQKGVLSFKAATPSTSGKDHTMLLSPQAYLAYYIHVPMLSPPPSFPHPTPYCHKLS